MSTADATLESPVAVRAVGESRDGNDVAETIDGGQSSETAPAGRSWLAPSPTLPWLVLALAVVAQTAQLVWIASDLGGESRALVANVLNLPVSLLAALYALRAGALRGVERRTRLAWTLVGGGFGLYFTGNLFWFIYESILETPPWSSAVDLIYLGNYPALLAGLLLFPVLADRRLTDRRFWLDAATVMVVGAAAVWYILLEPLEAGASQTLIDSLLAVGYPAGDLVLLFGVCAVLLRTPAENVRTPLTFLAIGSLLMIIADLWYGYDMVLNGAYESGSWTDAVFGLSGFAWLLSSLAFEQGLARSPGARHTAGPGGNERRAEVPRTNLLPYASVLLGYGMLVYVSRDVWAEPLGGLIFAAVVVTALVVLRQIVAVRDNTKQEARFRSLVQRSSDLITIVDALGIVRYQSPSLVRVLGRSIDSLVGRPLEEISDGEQVEALRAAIRRAATSREGPVSLAWRLVAADGSLRDVETMLTNLLDDAAVNGIVLNTRDVTERAALEEQLTHQAYHDPLTGLPNRTRLRDRLRASLAGGHSEGIRMMVIDLDGFKTVNDSLGHHIGDRLLTEVSSRLLAATRGSDMVVRLGGDEFAILLYSIGTDEQADLLAERLLSALQRPFALEGTQVVVGMSIGIARCPARGAARDPVEEQIDLLLRSADTAMYASKAAGKNRFTWFEPGMHAAAVERLTVESEMREGLARDEFRVHFQPIVHFESGLIQGVEALVRWEHPARGLIQPGQFIQIAEDTGLIVPLGRFVLREACRAGAAWQRLQGARGESIPPFGVAVNVSGRQLDYGGLFEDVRLAIAESGIEPSSLVLELTESTMIENPDRTRARLIELRELGVRFAIDDFGTGYSSLSYLQHFPIDLLKIDRAFIERLTSPGSHSALVRAIIALGEAMSLRCVAEGVEIEEQKQVLQGLGCEFGQGFHFARPMAEGDVTSALLRQGPPPHLSCKAEMVEARPAA